MILFKVAVLGQYDKVRKYPIDNLKSLIGRGVLDLCRPLDNCYVAKDIPLTKSVLSLYDIDRFNVG